MRRNVSLSVVFLCGAVAGWLSAGWQVGRAEPSSGDTKREVGAPATLRDPSDYLWLVNVPDPKQLAVDLQEMRLRLEKSKVGTVESAKSLALHHKLTAGRGLLAEEGASVVGLLRVGVEVPAFAKRGDLIWVVRIVHMWHGVTQEMWISSTTGAIRSMLPYAGNPGSRE